MRGRQPTGDLAWESPSRVVSPAFTTQTYRRLRNIEARLGGASPSCQRWLKASGSASDSGNVRPAASKMLAELPGADATQLSNPR